MTPTPAEVPPRSPRRACVAAVMALALVVAVPGRALAAPVWGRVVMGTAGAGLPGNLRVTVLQNGPDGRPHGEPVHVPVAPDGGFTFEADPSRGHLIGLFYGGAAYSRQLEPGQTAGIELKIYETTTDASVVKIASDSMTILQSTLEGQSDVLEVLQLLRFRNESDRTYAGPDPGDPGADNSQPAGQPRAVVRLPLPESAFDLAPADPGNAASLATTGGRLVTTSALVPGETSVAYLYKVKVPRSGWQLRREVHHPTDHVDLLIGKALDLAAAPGFEFAESTNLGGQEYSRYRAGSKNPGAVVEADIVFAGGSSNGVWYGAATLAAALGALLLFASIRMRRRRVSRLLERGGEPAPTGAAAKPGEPTRRELIEQVAALDEQFETGGLDDQTYRARRSSLLARLSGSAENP